MGGEREGGGEEREAGAEEEVGRGSAEYAGLNLGCNLITAK